MIKSIIILLVTCTVFGQDFLEVKGFNWKIAQRRVILHSKVPYSIKLLNEKLKPVNATVGEKLNSNGYYLVNIRNNSKTVIIWQRQIEKLKKLDLFDDIIPIFQFEKNTTIDIYKNSAVVGFTQYKNDSLFNVIKNLQSNINACFEKSFRLNQNFQRAAQVTFEIKKGKTDNFRLLGSDVKDESQLACLKRIILNQYWGNESAKGRVSYSFIIHQIYPKR